MQFDSTLKPAHPSFKDSSVHPGWSTSLCRKVMIHCVLVLLEPRYFLLIHVAPITLNGKKKSNRREPVENEKRE